MRIPDVIFSAAFDRALAWTMLHSIWQATLIALLTGFLLLALRRQSARLRYGLANLALLAILCSAAGTFAYYLPSASENIGVNTPVLPVGTGAALPVPRIESPAAPGPTLAAAAESDRRLSFGSYFNAQLPLIVLVWFLGMTAFLCRLLSNLTRVHYLRHRMNFPADPYWGELLNRLAQRAQCRSGIALLESALVRSPLTIGYFKPLILFPIGLINRLSEQEVEAVLAHELAHILRRDYLFNLLQSLVEVVFYFHPAVWWLSAQVRQERESACDDQAIALLGCKIGYAKALVSVQEMAFYSQQPALAFAGAKRNHLLERIQRLFSPPTTKFNIMEKWIATGLVVCSLVALTFGQRLQQNTSTSTAAAFTHNSGLWEADFKGDSVCMTFSSKTQEGNWMNGECFAKSNFSGLPVAPGETVFKLTRPAGTMTMTGKMENNAGYGRFEFVPSESYRQALAEQGLQKADDELLIQCFFANFPADYLVFLKKAGYAPVSSDELMELAVFRLNEVALQGYLDLAASLGKKSVPLSDLVQLKVANVGPESVKQLAKAGYTNLNVDEVTQLALQNVHPAYIDSMNALGFGKLSVDDLISAKVQGVDAHFALQCQNLNLGQLSFDDIVNVKIQNIDVDFISECRNMGLGDLSFEDIMSAKIQGVDADFVKKCQQMGLGNLSFNDIMSIKIEGIDGDFIKQCQSMGLKNLSFDEVMSIKIQGIDADFVQQCRQMGFDNLSFDDIMSMKIHGITPAYVQQCKGMELGDLDLDDIMTMKIHNIDAALVRLYHQMDLGEPNLDDLVNLRVHNITPEQVAAFRDLHFENLTVDDLVNASIQQVTPEFIKEANQKGYRFPTLQEYVDLKLRGQLRGKRGE